MPWDTVVQRIVELQRTSRLCIVKEQLTAQDIANRILRKDNFMVALVNRGLLPLQVTSPLAPSWLVPNLLTKVLEWNLYMVVFNAMFDKQFRIRQSFTQDVRGLQRRFVLCGLLNILLAPFVAAFMLIFFSLKHAEEWYRRPTSSALSREYSRHARWSMREFNELQHIFDARVNASAADATAYVKQFPAPLLTLLMRFVTFIVSSVAAVLLVLSILNENVLIFFRFPHEQSMSETAERLPGFNLLWWLAMASTILAISRSFSAEGALPDVSVRPEALLESLSRHTHYMPEHWRGRAHTQQVYFEFRSLYQYRVVVLLHEILGCLTAPLLLCLALPLRAPQILEFIRTFTAYSEGVGHVCSFALFDFGRHGDVRYGAPTAGPLWQQSWAGKMEKSFVNFRAHHPSYRDDKGDGLLDNIIGPGGAEAAQAAAVAAAASRMAARAGDASPPSAVGDERAGAADRGGGLFAIGEGSATEDCSALEAAASVIGASTFGAGFSPGTSQLLLLSRSSQLDSLASLGPIRATYGGNTFSMVAPAAAAAAAAASSCELRGQQLAGELICRVSDYHRAAGPMGGADDDEAATRRPTTLAGEANFELTACGANASWPP